jgi:hypothetical protein
MYTITLAAVAGESAKKPVKVEVDPSPVADTLLIAALAALGGLIAASIYGLLSSAVRKRVQIRSPEARTIEQIIPAVNALIEANGPMMQGIIAILEAQKGECNGNVDAALKVNREAKKKFDRYLISQAKVV